MIKNNQFYIVDYANLAKIQYLDTPFITENRAKEAIDNFLGRGSYKIIQGRLLKHLGYTRVKGKRAFRFDPLTRATTPIIRRIYKQNKRDRLKGTGIRTWRFKALWEDLPESREKREGLYKKGRDKIRGDILK